MSPAYAYPFPQTTAPSSPSRCLTLASMTIQAARFCCLPYRLSLRPWRAVFSGFGSALIFIPLASTVIGPKAAAPLLLIIDGVAAAGLIPRAWRHADRRDVGIMSIGALAGIPLGAWVLIKSDPLWIRWAVALFGTLLLALLMSGWRYRGKPAIATTVMVGAAAGLLGGAAQIGGPPVVATGSAVPLRLRPCAPTSFFTLRYRP